jgi:LDH2 family malate/lactate/ureidoglycolate dehydrogenase
VPEGVVRSLRNRGLPAPPGALRDADGNDTNDPSVLYASPRGTIQPLGGAFGYRGTALGILVDVLAALLADDEADDLAREGSNLAVLAIAADAGFAGRAGRMARYVRSSPPRDPAHPVMMPGEREQAEMERAAGGPILVDVPTWQSMKERAARLGLAVPVAQPA